nr:MAG TPA: hypothetical protein [Caudoviricetes sp.]DAN89590.1 MAG TPA: hypothetical protein [Caudoviricetes sp.]DAO39096.1 MAG TPA: hypothetical protein [Caudoviricetes sp.]DAS27365.1 MAG TPA: hypothetical protein [Caudoviricetes sp.]DAS70499.1 MAG TPA: hypothetical protein [Caudoviricetes sp.]
MFFTKLIQQLNNQFFILSIHLNTSLTHYLR